MKSIRNIAFSALLTIGAFTTVTYTSCNKDECKDVVCQNGGTCDENTGNCICTTGFTGTNCETQVRTKYFNTYKGNGTDNEGNTYTGWSLKFYTVGTDALSIALDVLDDNNSPQLSFTAKLNTNTTFTIDPKNSGLYSYTGNGTINETSATLTVNEKTLTGTTTTIYTFNNMIKQ